MGKYILIVTTRAKAGKDEEFKNWYKNVHIPELLQISEFIKGTRYYSENSEAESPYLAIYEIESNDIKVTMDKLQARSKDMTRSEAMDEEFVSLQVYKLLD